MRLQGLLKLQQPATDINDLRAQSVSCRALAPRSRTDSMLDMAQEAQACFNDQVANVQQRLQREEERSLDLITDAHDVCSKEILYSKEECLNALLSQQVRGRVRQEACQEEKLAYLKEGATIPSDQLLFQLRDVNRVDSLQESIRNEVRYRPDALPLWVRVVSRKNEKYGVNKENTPIANTFEVFYDLLMGTAEDAYQSDHSPYMQAFAQGKDGCFWLKQHSTNSYEESNASGDCPYAAVAAVTFHNKNEEPNPRLHTSFYKKTYILLTIT